MLEMMEECTSSVQGNVKNTFSWAEIQESLSGQRHLKRQSFKEQRGSDLFIFSLYDVELLYFLEIRIY